MWCAPSPGISTRTVDAREYVHAFLGIVVVTRGDGAVRALLVGLAEYDVPQSSR